MKLRREDPKWVISHTVELILQFPKLDELTLVIDEELEEYDYFIERICEIHTLRKLKIVLIFFNKYRNSPREHDIDKLGKIIAANPDLTHLVLHKFSGARSYSLSDVFRYVHTPLKLEHLSILSSFFEVSSAIDPHIHSLTSCNFDNSLFLAVLLAKEVFPPIMGLGGINDLTIAYLKRHPRITSLSLSHRIRQEDFSAIFEILIRHANTLTHLEIQAASLVNSLDSERNELLLLQYTNLEQLTLHPYSFWPLSEDFRIRAREVGVFREVFLCAEYFFDRRRCCPSFLASEIR